MIFVITGTEKYQFDRLVQEIDLLKREGIISDDILIQLGACRYEPKYCLFKRWFPFNEMVANIQKASLVIAHAGAGTTLLCLEYGIFPIIITRKKEYGEHVDNHQVPFARMMEKLQHASVAYDIGDLKECIINYIKNKTTKLKPFKKDNSQLIRYLNNWVNNNLIISKTPQL